jgi:hypothetical protein
MNIPSFIEELVEEGIPVTLQKGGSFHIEGFYKSSGVTVQLEDDGWVAVARYNEVTQIETLHDLAGLNYHWWQCSKDRYDGWAQPDPRWVPLLLQFGYIKEKTIPAQTVYE